MEAGAWRSQCHRRVPAPGAWGRGEGWPAAGSHGENGFLSVVEGRLDRTGFSSMFVSNLECFSRSPDVISLEID